VGKRSFTTTGSSTLTTAMPARATTLSSKNKAVPGAYGRAARPMVNANNPDRITRAAPNFRAKRGASRPTDAKQTTGTEVSRPAVVELIPRPVRISVSTGPTLVTASRRFTAASSSATSGSSRRYVVGVSSRSVFTTYTSSTTPLPAARPRARPHTASCSFSTAAFHSRFDDCQPSSFKPRRQ
jgi:hypothetical protein